MQTRRGRARLSAALATFCTLVVIALPPAQAANSGGRPESFQPDLATGRLTTTISVPVPPGRHGVQPTIALQYASGSTAALAGYGWTLEVGGTERGTRFGVVSTAGNQNVYTLSAQGISAELTQIAPGEYRATDEGAFWRYTFDGYAAWQAWDPAGTHYVFDVKVNDPNGRVFAWYLSRTEDRQGNTMTFTYTRDSYGWGQYLSQIDYTGHTNGLLPTNQVKLTWEDRPDPIPSMREGLSNTDATYMITKRLKTIETYANAQLVRRLTLTYTPSPATQRSLLTQVQTTGADGTTTLPPQTFSYSTPAGNYQTATASTWLSGVGNANTQPFLVDLNNDTKADLLLYDRATGTWSYCLSTGTGFQAPVSIPVPALVGQAFIGDFNGDGKIDLGIKDANNAVQIALATGVGTWGPYTQWLAPFGNQYYQPFVADFNGDGKTDFATWEPNGGYVHVGLSTGTSFATPTHLITVGPNKFPLLGDVNGDGLPDVGFVDTNGNVDVQYGTGAGFLPPNRWLIGFTNWQTWTPIPCDLNNDGRMDYVAFGGPWGYWFVGASTGTQFQWPAHILADFGTNKTPLTGDVNGDGLQDIGYFDPATGTWVFCLRQGNIPDLLTQSNNGVGGTVSAIYAPSSSFDNTANGVQQLGFVFPVLTALTTNDGRGNSYTSTFSYSGGLFDYSTREFRGFAYAKATDPDGQYSESFFHQDEHKKGKPYKETVTQKSPGSTGPTTQINQQSTDLSNVWFLGHDGGDNTWLAQSFVPAGTGAQRLEHLEVYVSTATGLNTWGVGQDPSGGFTVELQTDSGGNPSGTLVDPNAVVLLNPPQRGAWNAITFPVPIDLTPGTAYWLVMKYQGVIASATCYGIGISGWGAGAYPPGIAKRKYVSGTWDDRGLNADFGFKVWVNVPSTVIPPKLLQQVDRTWTCVHPWGVETSHWAQLTSLTTSLYDGQTTPKQTKVDYTYDSYGNVLTQTESGDLSVLGDERTTTTDYVYNPALWLLRFPSHTVVRDALNQPLRESWAYYDGDTTGTAAPTKGLLTKSEVWLNTSATRPTSTVTYDAYGNALTTTDPLNRTTTTTYDTQGLFPLRVANALGQTLATTYDPGTGNVLTTTDPNGQVTTTQYDALGRPTAVIGPLDPVALPGVLYSYDLASVPTKRIKQVRTTPGGSELYTSYEFSDGMGRVIQGKTPAQDPTQQVVSGTQVFDTRGLVKEAYKPVLTATSTAFSTPDLTQPKSTMTYDPLGRLLTQTNPDGTRATTSYNQWVVTLTDETGKQKLRTQDAYGKLIKVEEKNGADTYTTTYMYDPLGSLTKTTDAKGNVTTIAYDSVGRKTAMTDPDMGSWTYTYDLVGNLLTQTDAKGQALAFTYDALNRVTQKTGPGLSVTYRYDDPAKVNGVGRLAKVTDATGSTEFFYDVLGREIKTLKVVAGLSYTFERTYDGLNRLLTLKYPDAEVLTYTYNPQGISTVTGTVPGGGLSPYVTSVSYTPTGQLSQQVVNGTLLTTTYTYDPQTLRLSNLKLVNGANIALQDLNYAFDAVGDVLTLTDNRRTQTQTFTYDDLHRLTSAASPGTYGTRTYGYDSIGNLTLKDGVTQTYAHATKPHAVTSRSDGLTMTYDANGNMVTKGTQALAYDAENRLISVTSGSVTQASFSYDGDGGRVKKTTAAGPTTYLGKLWEVKPDGSTVKYIWVGATRLASKASTGATLFYHPNHLGSTDLVTDAAGTQVAHYEYTPWGELFSTEGLTVPHLYTGKERDPETGFYFYEARYYDPQLGRFLTPDTIIPVPSDPQAFNRYSYAHNNPLVYTDPTGHSWKKFWKHVGHFFRTVVAPVAAAVVFIVATPFVGPPAAALLAAATYNQYAVMGANLERGRGFFESYGRGMLAAGATLVGGTVGGGAASAALTGQDPGRGALLGAVQGATAAVGGALGAPLNDVMFVAQSAAIGAAAGAASAAIVGGDPGRGALYGAAAAAVVAAGMRITQHIANGDFQRALDAGRAQAGVQADRPVAQKIVQLNWKDRAADAMASRPVGDHPLTGVTGRIITGPPMVVGSQAGEVLRGVGVGIDNVMNNPLANAGGTIPPGGAPFPFDKINEGFQTVREIWNRIYDPESQTIRVGSDD